MVDLDQGQSGYREKTSVSQPGADGALRGRRLGWWQTVQGGERDTPGKRPRVAGAKNGGPPGGKIVGIGALDGVFWKGGGGP